MKTSNDTLCERAVLQDARRVVVKVGTHSIATRSGRPDYKALRRIVNGVSDSRFAPDAAVTREQLVTILFRRAGDGARADLSVFPDAGEISGYARDAMSWAVARGLVNGVSRDGAALLSPRGGATRAQVAAILMRFLG